MKKSLIIFHSTCSFVRSKKCARALTIGKTAYFTNRYNESLVTTVATSSIAFNANPSISFTNSSSSSRNLASSVSPELK